MSLRSVLESYFIDYPTCEEDEIFNQQVKSSSDEEFGKNVIEAIESLKREISEFRTITIGGTKGE